MARPMPFAAPVTIATLPVSLSAMLACRSLVNGSRRATCTIAPARHASPVGGSEASPGNSGMEWELEGARWRFGACKRTLGYGIGLGQGSAQRKALPQVPPVMTQVVPPGQSAQSVTVLPDCPQSGSPIWPASARGQQKQAGPEASQGASATHSFLPEQNARGPRRHFLRLRFPAPVLGWPRMAATAPKPTAESASNTLRREASPRGVPLTESN